MGYGWWMIETEREILEALREMEAAAAAVRSGGVRLDLGAILGRLGRLTAALPPEADPELAHYMRRQSYEKARLWLEGRMGAGGLE